MAQIDIECHAAWHGVRRSRIDLQPSDGEAQNIRGVVYRGANASDERGGGHQCVFAMPQRRGARVGLSA